MTGLQNSVLRNRYEMKKLLDKGGMGSVYFANDILLDEEVVVKVTQIPEDDDELGLLRRMQREYKILHKLDHDNIVKAKDFFFEAGQSFLVMEYIKANPLDKIINSLTNFLTIDEKLSIAKELIATVDYINKNDIIHRDIKPSNILLGEDLKPILVDFGISKPYRTDFETVTKGAAVMGTYDYMSPEQISMESLTFSDVFSLGVVIYQLFTWQKIGPFHAVSPLQISRNILSNEIPKLTDVLQYREEDVRKIQKISDVVSKMLKKKPEDRIKLSTALEVLEELAIDYFKQKIDFDVLIVTSTDNFDTASSNRYSKFESIAQGSMGEVFKVWDSHLQKEVALKTLISQNVESEKDRLRFLREAKITKELVHPYIVEVYDFGRIGNRYFFTMEFLKGKLLLEILQEGQYSHRELLEMFIKICQAVEYAHSKKCIHRDLKPENIIVLDNGNPKVTDFGLAKMITDKESFTTQGCIMGTAQYMSPEQAMGSIDEVDQGSDIYALGVMLYLFLTGTFPFSGKSTFEILLQTISKKPPEVCIVNPEVPKALSDICMKAIKKHKANRYQSVGQLHKELLVLVNDKT